jgi:glycosyltransferase involved in cell wall biosynthesis
MKLSVITINYNNLAGLRKTAMSVISQDFSDFEYIIIDGDSTDGSKELLPCFLSDANSRKLTLKYISEPDRGIYHAMNKGIALAKGEYVHFLNSGDWLLSESVYSSIFADSNDNSPIIYGNMLKILPSGRRVLDKKVQNLSYYTFYRGSLNQPVYFHRRSLFEDYGLFDEEYRIVADWKWYFRVVLIEKVPMTYKNIDVALFDMNGISSTNKTLDATERKRYLNEIIPLFINDEYERNMQMTDMIRRLNRYKLIMMLFHLFERVLFKYERFLMRINILFFHNKLRKIKNEK